MIFDSKKAASITFTSACRPLHVFPDLAAVDGPTEPCAQHLHDQFAGQSRFGGCWVCCGSNQRQAALRTGPVLGPDGAAALKPAPIR